MSGAAVESRPRPGGAFSHEALLYEGLAGFIEGAVPFLREGVAADDDILVVVSGEKIALLRDELAGDAQHVAFADMSDVGSNPAHIIPAWRDFASGRRRSRGLRGIGEPIWAERSAAELIECQRHEALLNVAFADTPGFRLLCPYDTTALDPATLDEAERSHPVVRQHDTERRSEVYGLSQTAAVRFEAPLPAPAGAVREMAFGAGQLTAVRSAAADAALAAGLNEQRVADVVLAVQELATNSLRHAGGHGTLRTWREPAALIFEVRDGGAIDDPLADRRRPAPGQEGGQGLWLISHLCDLVQVRTFPSGNVIRVHIRTH